MSRKQRLEQEQQSLTESEQDQSIQQLSGEVQQLEALISEKQEQNQTLTDQIKDSRTALQQCQEDLNQVRREAQSANGKHASLEALQQAAVGQDNSVLNDWLNKQGLSGSSRLGEGLSVDKGWETAVEAVLGDYLQAVCAADSDLSGLLNQLPGVSMSMLTHTQDTQAGDGRQR